MPGQLSAQPLLGTRPIHAANPYFVVEVNGPDIHVRTPDGKFRVTYRRSISGPQLVLTSEWAADPKESAIRQAILRAYAWRLANDTASKLGWFNLG